LLPGGKKFRSGQAQNIGEVVSRHPGKLIRISEMQATPRNLNLNCKQ
jgi:hypothetical protein